MADARTTDSLAAVREAEAAIRPVLLRQLRDAVGSDSKVEEQLRDWGATIDVAVESDGTETAIQRAAAREANVRTNLVRYYVAVGREPPTSLRTTPVTPFRRLDSPPTVEASLGELAATLARRSDAGDDLLGTRYADVLADEERRARGQFYTPTPIADLVVRWALSGVGDQPRVLDPAAGTGTFSLAAYDVLRERNPDVPPGTLLSRLLAVDVDDVALHVAGLRLSARTGGRSIETFERRACSFFDLEPGPNGDLGLVDAVVGNPPFVRAGDLSPSQGHYRDHLEAFGHDGAPYADGEYALSRRSDASVYFVTHATRFLRPGGRLGVVLPAKWLESDYGVGFRRFLSDQYCVCAVVGFGARAFDALVDTVLLLAERRCRTRPNSDDDVPVRFVRLDGPVDAVDSVDSLVTLAEGNGGEHPAVTRNGSARVVRRSQTTFAEARQCSPYLRAPEALLPLLDHSDLVSLGDLASISRGVTTGANRFFLLDAGDREQWGIDGQFLRPALRSIRGLDARTLSADGVEQSVLDVHGFMAERLDVEARDGASDENDRDPTERDPTERAKAALHSAGHDALVAYVEHAEAEGWHEGRTCQARRVWFDLGELPTPDAFVPKLLRERVFTVRNRAGAVPCNAIDCLSVREGIDPDVLLGVLDSSLCRALMEVWGRDEAGLLQLMTYETRTLPVPDVRDFSESEASAIRETAAALAPGRTSEAVQDALDSAVLGALDLDVSVHQVRTLRERLLRRRVDGGDRVEVPLSR